MNVSRKAYTDELKHCDNSNDVKTIWQKVKGYLKIITFFFFLKTQIGNRQFFCSVEMHICKELMEQDNQTHIGSD